MSKTSVTITAGDISLTDLLNNDKDAGYELSVYGTKITLGVDDLNDLTTVLSSLSNLYEELGKESP